MSSTSALSPPHFISVVRLADASTSSTTPAGDGDDASGKKLRVATFAVQIATKSNAKNYVAKCRNGLQNRKIKEKKKKVKKVKKNGDKDDDEEEEEEEEEEFYESLFRVKRQFPDDFLSLRNQLRRAYPGCVVPKLLFSSNENSEREYSERDAEVFLRRCCESPTIAASRMLETFLTEGATSFTSAARSSELNEEVFDALAEDADVRAVKEEQERRGRFSASAWFASLFNNGGGGKSSSDGVGAKERKYTRTRHSVLKDEDPTYLQVITYASKLDEQCEAFVRSAELYIDQLERRLNATKLRDLGDAALKMGQSEEGWGKALQKRSKNYSLGYTLHALSDCAESMTFTGTASELKACEALRSLVPCFEDCRQRVEAIRETFEDRTTALLHYQIACDVYDEVIETHGRAVANTHPECLEADAKRERRRKAYDLIVERTREEYPRWHASIGVDMTRSLRTFAKTRAALCRRDAECWEMMLRDPVEGDEMKMDDGVGSDRRLEKFEVEATAGEDGREQSRGKLLSTKEKLLLEKNARRIRRMEKRRKKEEREVLRTWKREAKAAIANGQNVPEMPKFKENNEHGKNNNNNNNNDNSDRIKSSESNGNAANRNEERAKDVSCRKGDDSSATSSSFSSSSSSFMPSSATTTATKTTSSSLFNSVEESLKQEMNVSAESSDDANYSSNVTKADERKQQQQQQQQEKPIQKVLLSRPPPEPLVAVKTEEASISEGLASIKIAAAAEDENDSEWSD
jgi:hypothetical protein